MKYITVLCAGVGLFLSCNGNGNQEEAAEVPPAEAGKQQVTRTIIPENNPDSAILTLESDSYDFGTLKEGEKAEHEFTFTNTGGTPLIISNVQASCGCTTPDYSKNPIAPGEQGKVTVVFNSAGQVGKQHKIVTLTSNAESKNVLLHLRGEVKK